MSVLLGLGMINRLGSQFSADKKIHRVGRGFFPKYILEVKVAYQYTFCVMVEFFCAIEHVFSDQDISDAEGSISTAFEYLESDLQGRLDVGAAFSIVLSSPKRRRSDGTYKLQGNNEVCRVFTEDCVVDGEELYLPDGFIDELKTELEMQWQDYGEDVSLLSMQHVGDLLMETEKIPLTPPC